MHVCVVLGSRLQALQVFARLECCGATYSYLLVPGSTFFLKAEVQCSNAFTFPRSCNVEDPKLSMSLNVLPQQFPSFVLVFMFLSSASAVVSQAFWVMDWQRAVQGSLCVLCILCRRPQCSGGVGSFSFAIVQRNDCGRISSDENPNLFGLDLLFYSSFCATF